MKLLSHFAGVAGALLMTLHGSRLFGVQQPDSDWDAKAVRLPPAHDLLLGDRTALAPTEAKLDGAEVTTTPYRTSSPCSSGPTPTPSTSSTQPEANTA